MNVRAVQKQVFTGVRRGPGTDNAAMKLPLSQQRNPARMINVCMGKHHIRDELRTEWKGFVSKFALFSPALKHPAIQKNSIVARCEQMHGAGNFSGSAVKSDVHGTLLRSAPRTCIVFKTDS